MQSNDGRGGGERGATGESHGGAGGTMERWKKAMNLENLQSQIRAGGNKIMKQAVQILAFVWNRFRRVLFFVLDRMFPPYHPPPPAPAQAATAAADESHDNDDETHLEGTPSSPSDSSSPLPPLPWNHREAWRRWFYHIVIHFFYPYITRFANILLARLRSLDPDT